MSVSIQLVALLYLFCFSKTSLSDLRGCVLGEGQQQAAPLFSIPGHGAQLPPSKASFPSHQRPHAGVSPPFLRHPFLFATNSSTLTRQNLRVVRASAEWLQFHPAARILIVGTCDSSGSEACTRALAEARGQAIKEILDGDGMHTSQISAVRVWDNLDHRCLPTQSDCQRLDRSAWIFVASSIAR